MTQDRRQAIELARLFASIARTLDAEPTVESTLDRVARLAVETIDGCDHCGVSLVSGEAITTHAATDPVPRRLDELQVETNEGPCLDAMRQREIIHVDALAEEQRWPAFSRAAAEETSVASVLAVGLSVDADALGMLNLYSKRPEAFHDPHLPATASVFAAHAALALSRARHDQQLEEAIATRDIIGQAKGILMARDGLTADEAFERLRQASQQRNIKLRALAEEVTYTGTLPGSHA